MPQEEKKRGSTFVFLLGLEHIGISLIVATCPVPDSHGAIFRVTSRLAELFSLTADRSEFS